MSATSLRLRALSSMSRESTTDVPRKNSIIASSLVIDERKRRFLLRRFETSKVDAGVGRDKVELANASLVRPDLSVPNKTPTF